MTSVILGLAHLFLHFHGSKCPAAERGTVRVQGLRQEGEGEGLLGARHSECSDMSFSQRPFEFPFWSGGDRVSDYGTCLEAHGA